VNSASAALRQQPPDDINEEREWQLQAPAGARVEGLELLPFQAMLRILFSAILVTVSLATDATITTGQGDWIYEYQPQLLQVPPSPGSGGQNVLNGHGVARDAAGNIYFTFQPANVGADAQVLVKWKVDGTDGVLLGEQGAAGLSRGVPHGLRLEHDAKQGKDFLYHANNAALVIKTDTTGKVVWTANMSEWQHTMPHFWPFKPTDAMVPEGSPTLYVADGYGTSWIHKFDKMTGKYLESFGGRGNTTSDPIKFSTPHSISADPRFPGQMVVTDRSNERLVSVSPDGKFISSHDVKFGGRPATGSQSLPCSSHFMNDKHGEPVALIPSLGDSHAAAPYNFSNSGSVGIYDKHNKLVSAIEVSRYLWKSGHQHPHDAIFLPNGDVVVCCYGGGCGGKPSSTCQQSQFPHVNGASAGTISYWKKVKKT